MRLKQLREEKRLSQTALAIQLNISQSTISMYETGERLPDSASLMTLADYFNVSVDYLLERTEYRKLITKEELSPLEADLLLKCRQMTQPERDQLLAFAKGLIHEI